MPSRRPRIRARRTGTLMPPSPSATTSDGYSATGRARSSSPMARDRTATASASQGPPGRRVRRCEQGPRPSDRPRPGQGRPPQPGELRRSGERGLSWRPPSRRRGPLLPPFCSHLRRCNSRSAAVPRYSSSNTKRAGHVQPVVDPGRPGSPPSVLEPVRSQGGMSCAGSRLVGPVGQSVRLRTDYGGGWSARATRGPPPPGSSGPSPGTDFCAPDVRYVRDHDPGSTLDPTRL